MEDAGVMLRVEVPATARLAVAESPVPPLLEETGPVMLVKVPAAVPVTFSVFESGESIFLGITGTNHRRHHNPVFNLSFSD